MTAWSPLLPCRGTFVHSVAAAAAPAYSAANVVGVPARLRESPYLRLARHAEQCYHLDSPHANPISLAQNRLSARLSYAAVERMVACGELPSVKIRSRRRVRAADLAALVKVLRE